MSPQYLTNDRQELIDKIQFLEIRLSRLEKMLMAAGGKFSFQTGESSITLGDTSLILKSKEISLVADGRINIKAGGEIQMKGAKIAQN
jgi:type VI secretion system secreted protein VgrG